MDIHGNERAERAVDPISHEEVSLQDRYSGLIQTQCQRSIRILGESTEHRPLSLRDFKETLEKSVSALNVSQ